MQVDWDYVKRSSLWPYEALVKKLQVLPTYPLLWRVYNHDMPRAAGFARRLLGEGNTVAGKYLVPLLGTMRRLEETGIRNWGELLGLVATRDACLAFVSSNNLDFKEVVDVLVYLLRWGFPFQTAGRELLAHDDPLEMQHYEALKQHRLMNNFDLLQSGFRADGRDLLARISGLPQDFVQTLVHRADIARLPFVRRKTILIVSGAGFDTLAKIAGANVPEMESCLDAYLRQTYGKPLDNYRSVILPAGLITAAQALPLIVQ